MRTTEKPNSRTVRLNLSLHPGQDEVRRSKARFKVVACGRQWGKSRLGSAVAFERALRGQAVWWVAPDYPLATIGWNLLKSLARQLPGVAVKESERLINFPGGGWLQVKSAHSEGSLRGVTLDYLVIDEAAFIAASRWYSELRPTLAVKGGGALFISTFDGENYFFDLYGFGQDAEQTEWESWRKISTENPYFDIRELEEARKNTPKAEFEQEYLANPLSYVGAVFEGELIQSAIERGANVQPQSDLTKYAGLDWGYTGETAFEVCQEDAEGRISWIDERRWTATELNVRCERIAELCAEYGIEMIAADAAGATEIHTLAETLGRHGLKTTIQPVAFGKWKAAAISTRRWYLENALEAIGPGCKTLGRETKKYRYKEDSEDVIKEDDHGIDGTLAFYATRAGRMVRAA